MTPEEPKQEPDEGKWFRLFKDNFDKFVILFLIVAIATFRSLNPKVTPVLSNEQAGMILGTLLGMLGVKSSKSGK